MNTPTSLVRAGNRGILATIVLALPLVLAGCPKLSLPRAPVHPGDVDPEFQRAGSAAHAGLDEDPPRGMRLYPGDVISVHLIATETTDHAGLVIDDLGNVRIPVVGTVNVGGHTLQEAESRIEVALRQYDRVSQVSITLDEPEGHFATVLGSVEEPGRHEILPGMRIVDLLATAGGLIRAEGDGDSPELADLYASRLVRDGQAIPVSIAQAVEGDPRHNVRVYPGDHLYIASSMGRRVAVLGHVGTPGVMAYREGLRLSQLLAAAGGITIDADDNDVRVVRGGFREPQVYVTSFANIVRGSGPDIVLAPGDTVFVTEHWLASFAEILDRFGPLLTLGTTITTTILLLETTRDAVD